MFHTFSLHSQLCESCLLHLYNLFVQIACPNSSVCYFTILRDKSSPTGFSKISSNSQHQYKHFWSILFSSRGDPCSYYRVVFGQFWWEDVLISIWCNKQRIHICGWKGFMSIILRYSQRRASFCRIEQNMMWLKSREKIGFIYSIMIRILLWSCTSSLEI